LTSIVLILKQLITISRLIMVKIDTKEKMHVITIIGPDIAANMTEKMDKVILALLDENVKNVVINLKDIQMLDNAAASHLLKLQQLFNERQASFVVCNLQPLVRKILDGEELLDLLNYAPTMSEAMDIVQMEELEREMGL
jgi:anti-anti-sigma factor